LHVNRSRNVLLVTTALAWAPGLARAAGVASANSWCCIQSITPYKTSYRRARSVDYTDSGPIACSVSEQPAPTEKRGSTVVMLPKPPRLMFVLIHLPCRVPGFIAAGDMHHERTLSHVEKLSYITMQKEYETSRHCPSARASDARPLCFRRHKKSRASDRERGMAASESSPRTRMLETRRSCAGCCCCEEGT
jgi:hypothetical protein